MARDRAVASISPFPLLKLFGSQRGEGLLKRQASFAFEATKLTARIVTAFGLQKTCQGHNPLNDVSTEFNFDRGAVASHATFDPTGTSLSSDSCFVSFQLPALHSDFQLTHRVKPTDHGSTSNWRSFGQNSADTDGGGGILILCTLAGKAVQPVSALRESNKAMLDCRGLLKRRIEIINAVAFPGVVVAAPIQAMIAAVIGCFCWMPSPPGPERSS